MRRVTLRPASVTVSIDAFGSELPVHFGNLGEAYVSQFGSSAVR